MNQPIEIIFITFAKNTQLWRFFLIFVGFVGHKMILSSPIYPKFGAAGIINEMVVIKKGTIIINNRVFITIEEVIANGGSNYYY
jgi:hypothetical protein